MDRVHFIPTNIFSINHLRTVATNLDLYKLALILPFSILYKCSCGVRTDCRLLFLICHERLAVSPAATVVVSTARLKQAGMAMRLLPSLEDTSSFHLLITTSLEERIGGNIVEYLQTPESLRHHTFGKSTCPTPPSSATYSLTSPSAYPAEQTTLDLSTSSIPSVDLTTKLRCERLKVIQQEMATPSYTTKTSSRHGDCQV